MVVKIYSVKIENTKEDHQALCEKKERYRTDRGMYRPEVTITIK